MFQAKFKTVKDFFLPELKQVFVDWNSATTSKDFIEVFL